MGHVDLQVGNNSSLCRLGPGFMQRVRHFGHLENGDLVSRGILKEISLRTVDLNTLVGYTQAN